MAQVTIYMNNELESKIKNIANSLNISISKFIANVLEQKVQNEWHTKTKQLAGSWDEFPTLEEIRETKADNIITLKRVGYFQAIALPISGDDGSEAKK